MRKKKDAVGDRKLPQGKSDCESLYLFFPNDFYRKVLLLYKKG